MATRSNGTTLGADATLSFDTGTFSANTVAMVARTGSVLTTGASSGTINIGGGTASLGAVTMAVNTATNATGSPGASTATLNISNGAVTASSINMANAVSTGIIKVANATINLTGGSLTMSGNITRTGGAGTENTTLTLDGGTLNMGGFNIGAAAAIGSGSGALNLRSGTLQNVAQINNGAAISKTTAGTLIVSGTNTWTGNTTVAGGTLQLNGGGSPTLGGTNVLVSGASTTLNVNGNTSIGTPTAGSISISAANTLSLLDSGINTLTLLNTSGTGSLTMNTGSTLSIDLSGGGLLNSVDSASVNKLTLSGGNSIVTLNSLGGGTLNDGTYTLLSYLNGSTLGGNIFTFTGGSTVLGVGGGRTYTLSTTGTSLLLQVGAVAAPSPVYWKGTLGDGSWATISGVTNDTNWVNAQTGGTDTHQVPGGSSNVFFTADSATNFTTTLDGSYSINSLTFTGTPAVGATADATNVTITNGTGVNTLTIGSGGIAVLSTTAAHTIGANVALSGTQIWNNSSTGTFTVSGGINTAGNGLTVSGGGNTELSGVISGAGTLTENGTGSTLTLSGAAANTFSGQTAVTGGVLALNKTAGVNAIVGDGASSKVTYDVLVNGGTLLWGANNQLDDTVSISMTSGSLDLNGKTETLYDLNISGGTFTTGIGANLTINDPTWSGGTNTIGSASTVNFGVLNISGGTNTVQGDAGTGFGGATLNAGSTGGLNFTGTASPNLTINSDAVAAGKVVLQGDVGSTVHRRHGDDHQRRRSGQPWHARPRRLDPHLYRGRRFRCRRSAGLRTDHRHGPDRGEQGRTWHLGTGRGQHLQWHDGSQRGQGHRQRFARGQRQRRPRRHPGQRQQHHLASGRHLGRQRCHQRWHGGPRRHRRGSAHQHRPVECGHQHHLGLAVHAGLRPSDDGNRRRAGRRGSGRRRSEYDQQWSAPV